MGINSQELRNLVADIITSIKKTSTMRIQHANQQIEALAPTLRGFLINPNLVIELARKGAWPVVRVLRCSNSSRHTSSKKITRGPKKVQGYAGELKKSRGTERGPRELWDVRKQLEKVQGSSKQSRGAQDRPGQLQKTQDSSRSAYKRNHARTRERMHCCTHGLQT